MTMALLAYLGGMLTILSPCILPVLPFVFARTGQRFLTHGLPLLLGMAATFAVVASLAAVGGAWAVQVSHYGRAAALALLAVFGLSLLSRRLATAIASPFAALGNRLTAHASGEGSDGVLSSVLIGVATGLLWAPCAGPILGLVLTGAALSGPTVRTTLLLVAYAGGAGTALALATLLGGRLQRALRRTLGPSEWLRRGLGVAILLSVAVIGLDQGAGILGRLSAARTDRIEQALIRRVSATVGAPPQDWMAPGAVAEGALPSLAGATQWLNSPPLRAEDLRGKVLLIDFWTYSCVNCLRTLPHVTSWYERYKDHGLVVIGIHAPEFAFERDAANVQAAIGQLGITYPVALDNRYALWKAFNNRYWPAHYFIDASGRIRGHQFGEGDYARTEQTIRELLMEAGQVGLPAAVEVGTPRDTGAAPSERQGHQSPETYLGFGRGARFQSAEGLIRDEVHGYRLPDALDTDHWALDGAWQVGAERAVLARDGGRIVYAYRGREVNLVLGPGSGTQRVRFRVTIDGHAPGVIHGTDVDAQGAGVVNEHRLYQLIRGGDAGANHTISVEFTDPGVAAYAFTFG